MFSFLKKKKIKKSDAQQEPIIGDNNKENNEFNYSSSVISPITHEKNLTGDKIHVDVTQNPSDKLLFMYDSSESSPRDLSNSSPHKNCLTNRTSTIISSQIGTSDLNRILTSGYLNGEENMGYMKRGGGDNISSCTKSPQFHRPIGFSYNRTQTFTIPGTKKGMKALVTGQTKIRKIHCSIPQSSSTPDHESTVEKEAIVLSRYSGGFIPDPTAPKKIESLDWPAPIALQAVPELMKSYRSKSESHSNPNEITHTISDNNDQQIPNENFNDDDELRHDEKLEKDINEMSKLKDSSGMAHALLEDLRIQEKIISRQLPLDPWKASRSPSAAIEPPQRCRFDSPKFASPSRRVYTHSSSTTNQDDSLTGLAPSISTTPTGGKRITLPGYQEQIFRPDYGLSPSSPKAQTLPNCLDIQRSCDLDSTINSCYSNDGDQNKSVKTVDIDGRYRKQYLESRHAHSTRSAPALMSNLKIYTYEELKIMFKKYLPSDVDRDHLERHLSDNEFYTLFQMTRSNFYHLPEWRRIDLKKRFKLF